MKRILLFSVFTLFFISMNAQTTISKAGKDLIDNFQQLRMELTEFQDNKEKAVELLQAYKNKEDLTSLNEEENLIFESFYISEYYNYTWNDKANDEFLKNAFLSQIEKNEAFIEKNKGNVSATLYILTADCFSCYMSYNPVAGAMKYGLKVRKYYENAIELEKDNSFGLTHLAQWFFWAPGINGGSKKKALANFKAAVDYAKTDAENFYALIFYSQMIFENGSKEEAASLLQQAKNIYPSSTYITELEYWNNRGYSLFGKDKKKAEEERNVSY